MSSKLREALRQVSRIAEEMTRKTMTGESEDRGVVDGWALRLCDIVSITLAEPLRNCDVGTAEEQIARFNKFCFPIKCSECQLHTDEDLHDCIFRWAQMPYEEVK